MKTKLYLLLLIVVTLASCSSENITESTLPASNELTLKRVETYNPTKAAYENTTDNQWGMKQVQYFENGFIVADSTFNNLHNLEYVTVHTQSSTAASVITYNTDNRATSTSLFTYDDRGRITELSVSSPNINYRKTVAYTTQGTATVTYHDTAESISNIMGTYTANQGGILSSFEAAYEIEALIFDGSKPVTYTQAILDSSTLINMEYYDIAVPANRLKTATQINNITVMGGLLESVANNCDYYLKRIGDFYSYSHTFNELNYISHSMFYNLADPGTTESFYYYNE